MTRPILALSALLALGLTAPAAIAGNRHAPLGAVYTMTNDTGGNAIVVYERGFLGRLRRTETVPTGGLGTGGGLGNQGALALSPSDRWLFAVNAGSDELSVLAVEEDGLSLRQTLPSGGHRPISVTARNQLVYVLHAGGGDGGTDGIAGFRQAADGRLVPIAGSARPLSAASADPAQIAFAPDLPVLVVTEKATNRIVTFVLDADGVPGGAIVHASSGETPFGFAFGRRDQLLVSEAFGGAEDASALSSYVVGADGSLAVVDGSVPTTETAACWTVVSNDGRFAYVTNTGSGSISAYRVGFEGSLRLGDRGGRSASTGRASSPIDVALSHDGRSLYALDATADVIVAYLVGADGALVPIQRVGGLPAGTNGLAAR